MRKPVTPWRSVRLSEEVWSCLLRIARRENLLYGGMPSAAQAIAWLACRDPVVLEDHPVAIDREDN